MYKDAHSNNQIKKLGDIYLTGTIVNGRMLAKYVVSDTPAGWIPFNTYSVYMQKIKRCDIEKYVTLPVYIKGYCWNRTFDGWTIIYRREDGILAFDYCGASYSVEGFLPNKFTMSCSSAYNNAFYNLKVNYDG